MGTSFALDVAMAVARIRVRLALLLAAASVVVSVRAIRAHSLPATATLRPVHCEASLDGWMQQERWPTESLMLGDQLYTRSDLRNLENSRGNAVANLAIEMATAQLNIEAGAAPSSEVIEALFASDQWLLDGDDSAARRSPSESSALTRLNLVLSSFNDWAGEEATCGATMARTASL